MGLFGRKKENSEVPVNLSILFNEGESTTYKEVEGFFLFNDVIFYKPKNGTGRDVKSGKSFSDVYLETVGGSENPVAVKKQISAAEVKVLNIK